MAWMVGELWIVLLLAGFAIGANEAPTGLASLLGARTLPLRLALLCGAAATAAVVLLLAGPQIATTLMPLFPTAEAGAAGGAEAPIAAALAALLLVMLAASAIGLPVPAALVLAAALAGAALAGSGASDGMAAFMADGRAETAILVAAAAFGLPLATALLAGAAGALVSRPILRAPRPRDRLRRLAPPAAGLTALAAVWLGLASFLPGRPEPLWLWAGLSLAAALAAGLALRLALARQPFAVANDARGADTAQSRLQLAGSLVLAAAQGGYQALLVAVPAALILGGGLTGAGAGGGAADLSPEAWLGVIGPLAVGLFAGILLLGHRTARRVGEAMAGLSASRGVAANLGSMLGLAGAGLAGLPMLGGQAAVGAAAGAGLATGTLRWGPLLGVVAGWLAGPALAAALAYGLMTAAS